MNNYSVMGTTMEISAYTFLCYPSFIIIDQGSATYGSSLQQHSVWSATIFWSLLYLWIVEYLETMDIPASLLTHLHIGVGRHSPRNYQNNYFFQFSLNFYCAYFQLNETYGTTKPDQIAMPYTLFVIPVKTVLCCREGIDLN